MAYMRRIKSKKQRKSKGYRQARSKRKRLVHSFAMRLHNNPTGTSLLFEEELPTVQTRNRNECLPALGMQANQ